VFTFGSLLVAIQVAGGQYTPRIIAATLLRKMVESLTQNLPEHRHPALREELDMLDCAMVIHYPFPENLALARIADSQGLGATSHKQLQE
jgi:hypothetical protein